MRRKSTARLDFSFSWTVYKQIRIWILTPGQMATSVQPRSFFSLEQVQPGSVAREAGDNGAMR